MEGEVYLDLFYNLSFTYCTVMQCRNFFYSEKTVAQFADRTFNLNKCWNSQTIAITKIRFYQRTHLCQYCGDNRYCRDSNTDPINTLSTLCNGKKTCRVKGQQFLNLSEACLGIRTYIQLAYNCTKGNLAICFNIQKPTTCHKNTRAKPPTCRWQTFS